MRNKKLNDLYCSTDIIGGIEIKDDGMGDVCSMYVGEELCIGGLGKVA
jgi:hypothetical protein